MSSSWWRSNEVRRVALILFLGQLVSLFLALCSLTSSLIATLGVDAPLSQMLFPYAGMALIYGSVMLHRRRKLLVPWYWYLLLGFADVQGNFLVNKAYQFSSITSVTLLDCWTIPWVIILTLVFLGTRYSIWQFIGAALCVLGLGLVFLSDAGVGGGGGTRPLLGDVLVIAGTFFFAISNVGEEFFVKKKDLIEVLCMLGVFGTLFSICEICIFEIQSLESIEWSTDIILSFCGYALAILLFYSTAPFVLKFSGAAMLNLSLLSSDMWAVVFRIFLYHQEVDWLYFLCFAIVVVGLIVYSSTEKDPIPVAAMGNGNHEAAYEALSEEFEGESNVVTDALESAAESR